MLFFLVGKSTTWVRLCILIMSKNSSHKGNGYNASVFRSLFPLAVVISFLHAKHTMGSICCEVCTALEDEDIICIILIMTKTEEYNMPFAVNQM